MKDRFHTALTLDLIQELYPNLDQTRAQLMLHYLSLTQTAVQLDLVHEDRIIEIEEKEKDITNDMERLQYQCAGILSHLLDFVQNIQVPTDPIELENWVKSSQEYPKVKCHDAFFDLFLATKKAL